MKLTFVENLSVKGKIIAIVGSVFVLLGLFLVFQLKEISSYENVLLVADTKVLLLEARRQEKNFLTRKDLQYAEKVNAVIIKIDSALATYGTEDTEEISRLTAKYSKTFNHMVELTKTIGLDENSGAEGKLRESIHSLEESISGSNDKTSMVDLLMCRRHEKDFFLRKKEKYVDLFKESVGVLRSHTESSLSSLIDNYETNFLTLSGTVFEINKEEEVLIADARKVEQVLLKLEKENNNAAAVASNLKLIALIISIFSAAFISYIIAKIISQALNQLISASKKILDGDYSTQLEIHSKDEFGTLATTFNAMVEKIEIQIKYLDNLPTPVMTVDKEFNVTYMNKIGSQIVGKTQEDCAREKCYNLFKTEHCNTPECRVRQAMEQKSVRTGETVARPQGKDIHIMYTGAPVTDRAGNLVGALEFVADISEMKEAQNYLARCTNKLLTEMDKFADGDLTVKVVPENENDEIGKLFDGFNKSVQNIKGIVENVTGAVQATASAANQISSSSEEMAAGAQEQSSQTTEVASAVEQMAKTILETTKNSGHAADAAKNSGVIAKEGGKVVSQTIEGMNRVADVVRKSAETVEALGKSSDQIGEIIQVIDDIADQTNLLALNAAIEAARAGEQGRGFAVVADEVRKLAERTTKATKEIATMIKQIQKDTVGAVESMKLGTEEVEKGKALADKAGQSLNQIITGAEEVVDMVTQVAAASEEQSSAAEQISKNIEGINNVTQESAAGVQQIARAAEDLSRLTVDLQDLISKFKIEDGSDNLIKNSQSRVTKIDHSVRSKKLLVH